jgi:TetR/AcrR family transcriptional repressor of nem operon
MRYSETHKAETHARLLKLAGRTLREKGPEGLAVAELMATAGLTHGGFYAHFKSKDALLTEALACVFEESRQRVAKTAQGLSPRDALRHYIDSYVSPEHRDRAGGGCPLVALNSHLPRQSRKFRMAFDAGVQTMVADLARRLDAAGVEGGESRAQEMVAAMAGAVAVSRAVSDKRLSDEVLATTRESIKARLGLCEAER